eukprot:c42341_g1_i1 orf=16-321(-)
MVLTFTEVMLPSNYSFSTPLLSGLSNLVPIFSNVIYGKSITCSLVGITFMKRIHAAKVVNLSMLLTNVTPAGKVKSPLTNAVTPPNWFRNLNIYTKDNLPY